MGNIEVVRQESRRKPIFDPLNSSSFRRTKSPRQAPQDPSTHRFSNNNRVYKVREGDGADTSRIRNSNYYRSSQKREAKKAPLQAHSQISQADSNRVVNFNDFLIEIKKQMTENSNGYSENESQLEQTLRRGEEERMQRGDSNRELKVNLRLENERFELDKYKKLVERELSKSHSIENISLESKPDNEKLLIIKYGEYGIESKEATLKPSSLSNPSTHLNDKISKEKQQYSETLRSAQRIMKELQDRTQSLGALIQSQEKQHNLVQVCENKEEQINRLDRISELMSGLDHIQNEQMALENEIKAAILCDDDSDLSQTLTEKELSVGQSGRR